MSSTSSITTTGGLDGPAGLSTDGILYSGAGLVILGADGPVGDDGGWIVTASGAFPTTIGLLVWIVVPYYDAPGFILKPCFSGVHTQGYVCWSEDSATLKFVVPPLPITPPRPSTPLPFNPFDIFMETTDGLFSGTGVDLLEVIHRSYTTNLYSLRNGFPPPYDAGQYDIDGENYGG